MLMSQPHGMLGLDQPSHVLFPTPSRESSLMDSSRKPAAVVWSAEPNPTWQGLRGGLGLNIRVNECSADVWAGQFQDSTRSLLP